MSQRKKMNPKNQIRNWEKLAARALSRLSNSLPRRKVGTVKQMDPREKRMRLFDQDIVGRTPLFYAAEKGNEEQVLEMIYTLRGTGFGPPRLALITTKDVAGLTAADVAEQNGHEEIARLLRVEQGRMEFFE